MVTDQSRRSAMRLCDAMNQRDFETVRNLIADDYFSHANPEASGPVHGPEVGVQDLRKFVTAFPDYRVDVLDLVAEDDRSVLRVRETGTHLGDDLGLPASGRRMDIEGVWILRFDSHGKLVELWVYEDNLVFMQQLGAIPEDILG